MQIYTESNNCVVFMTNVLLTYKKLKKTRIIEIETAIK